MTNEINSSKQIKLGAIVSYIAIAFNILAGLLYTPWLISKIGQADYGLYTLCASIIGFFAMDFGIGGAMSRFLSKYRAEGNQEKLNTFLGIIVKLFLIIDAIIFSALLVMFILIEQIYIKLTPAEIEKLKVLYVIAGMFSVISFPFQSLDGILISYEHFVFQKFTILLRKTLVVALMISALLMGYGLYAIVLVDAFIGIVIIVLKYIYVKKRITLNVDIRSSDKDMLKNVIGFMSWSTIIIFAERFILNITPTVLGRFSGSVQISIFSIGMTIEGYAATFAQAINGMFLPKISRMLTGNNDIEEFENLMIRVGRIQLYIIGIILVGFIIMGKEFMVVWAGEGFVNSYFVAMLLLLPFLVTLTQDIATTMIMAKNKVRYRAISMIIKAIVSFSLSLMLTPIYGAIGASLAIFIGGIVEIFFINTIYLKVLNINIFKFFRRCHLRILPVFAVISVFGEILQLVFPANNLIGFAAKVMILCMFYVVIIWNFSFDSSEKALFMSVFNGIKNIKLIDKSN